MLHPELLWAKATVCSGRLKGEKVTIIGDSSLNMDYRLIVRRTKGRNKIMGFSRHELRITKETK